MYWLGAIFLLLAVALSFSGLFDVKLGITLAVVEIPIIVFGASVANFILRESRQHAKEIGEEVGKQLKSQSKNDDVKKERHKRDLINLIFSKLADLTMTEHSDGEISLELRKSEEQIQQEEAFEGDEVYEYYVIADLPEPQLTWAFEHLKEYPKIDNLLEELFTLTEKNNTLVKKSGKTKETESINAELFSKHQEFMSSISFFVNSLKGGIELKGKCKLGY